ncbi:MAG: hypothetical protein NTW29_02550 [Bacteroidetes bacterium]|nr:hypothetical protein [Bacteroidota bacterium]
MSTQRKIETDRYPGPKPYEESEKDLFFGRSQETEALFESVSVNNVFVLHAESGLGKSSLIAAGLMPRLRTGNFLPVLIRFKNRKTSPMKAVTDAIHEAYKKNLRDTQSTSDNNALLTDEETDTWKMVKKINFQGFVPVLIFDQFEEFNYFPAETRKETILKLGELTALRLPDHIRRETNNANRSVPENWYSQPEVKLIFSIRTDRIGIMEELADAIPDTRTNRYELSPMMAEQGEQVIILPAAMESSEDIFFNSQPFQYEPGLIKTILDIVRRKNNTIDTTQLQIICLEIQERVKSKITQEEMLVVTEKELGGKTGLEDLVKNFYVKQLAKISEKENIDPVEYQSIRVLLEKKMIVQGKKDRLSEDAIFQHFRNRDIKEDRIKPLLDELLSLRLIRGIDFEESTFYEIAHDTLISPILQEMENRERKEAVEKEKKQAEEQAKTQAEELRKQRLQTAKEVELRKKATEAEIHAREEERKAKDAEEKAKAAERKANEVAAELSKNVAKLEDAVKRKRRMQRFVFGAVVIFFLLSIFLVYYLLQTRNSRREVSVLTAYKNYITGDSAYEKANHKIAANNYIWSADAGNADAAEKLNQLPFSLLAWTDSAKMKTSFTDPFSSRIVYSNDKSKCLILNSDRTAMLWNIQNEKPEFISSVPNTVNPVFSDDNRYLLYFRPDTTPVLYDITAKQVRNIAAAKEGMEPLPSYKLTINPEIYMGTPKLFALGGSYMIVTTNAGLPYLITPPDSTGVAYYHRLTDYIRANPLDQMASFSSVRGEIKYNMISPTGITNNKLYALSPDGKYLATYNPGNSWLFIYDFESKKQVFAKRNISDYVFTNTNSGIALLERSGNVFWGDCKSPAQITAITDQRQLSPINKILLSPDKKKLYLESFNSETFDFYFQFSDSTLYSIGDKLKAKGKSGISFYAFSLGDIYISPRDNYYSSFFLMNLNSGDTALIYTQATNNILYNTNYNRLVFVDDSARLHILNASNFTQTGLIEQVNATQIYQNEKTGSFYYSDESTHEIMEIDPVSNQKKSLGHTSAEIKGMVNSFIELELVKPGTLTGTHCLVNPGNLALKGEEKIKHLLNLFKISRQPRKK